MCRMACGSPSIATGLWFWLWFRLRYTRPPVRQNTGDYALQVIDFYAAHYHEFVLHNKENKIFDSYETMKWGAEK